METLSADERARASRFHFERDRRRYIAARGALRAILAEHLADDPARIEFAYGAQGKPILAGRHADSALHFNLSHSENQALVAVGAGRPLGVDLEHVRPFRNPGERPLIIFSAAELSEFSALPTAVHDRAFYNAWTRKEALVKALGLGFSMDVTAVEVSFAPDVPARLVRLHGDAAAASEWTLVDLAAPRGFVAALAVRGPVGELELREWPTLNRE